VTYPPWRSSPRGLCRPVEDDGDRLLGAATLVRNGEKPPSVRRTSIIRFQPGPGILIEERLVIVDNGREIRAAVMVPTAVAIASVHQRIQRR
jgi:hypothetical protein